MGPSGTEPFESDHEGVRVVNSQGAMEQKLLEIRELHRYKFGWISHEEYCEHCGRGVGWPCPTVAILDRETL